MVKLPNEASRWTTHLSKRLLAAKFAADLLQKQRPASEFWGFPITVSLRPGRQRLPRALIDPASAEQKNFGQCEPNHTSNRYRCPYAGSEEPLSRIGGVP